MFLTFFSVIWLWIGRQRSEGRARSAGSHRHPREGCRCSCDLYFFHVLMLLVCYTLSCRVVAVWIIAKVKALSTWMQVFYTNVARSMRFGLSSTGKHIFFFFLFTKTSFWVKISRKLHFTVCTQKTGVLGWSSLFNIIFCVQRIFTRPVYLINSRRHKK